MLCKGIEIVTLYDLMTIVMWEEQPGFSFDSFLEKEEPMIKDGLT